MHSLESDVRVQTLVAKFIELQKLEMAARERWATTEGNRQVKKFMPILQELSTSAKGRQALEQLLTHEVAEIRLRAAERVIKWAPEKAIPVLGRLLVSWRVMDPNKGYIGVRFEAACTLYEHFGIEDFDGNKLIEPMRAYGIDLPRRPD